VRLGITRGFDCDRYYREHFEKTGCEQTLSAVIYSNLMLMTKSGRKECRAAVNGNVQEINVLND
jgi:hypothetical protein